MGGKPIRLTAGARAELLRAVDFYDEQASLGPDLYAEVQPCLGRFEALRAQGFQDSVRLAHTCARRS